VNIGNSFKFLEKQVTFVWQFRAFNRFNECSTKIQSHGRGV